MSELNRIPFKKYLNKPDQIKRQPKTVTSKSYTRTNSVTPSICRKCGKPVSSLISEAFNCTCPNRSSSIRPSKQNRVQNSLSVLPNNQYPNPVQTQVDKISGYPLKARNFSSLYRTSDFKATLQTSESLKDSFIESSFQEHYNNYKGNHDKSLLIEKRKKMRIKDNAKIDRKRAKDDSTKHKFLVFKGNNSGLVKTLMDLRQGWCEGYYSLPSSANFIWMPTSYNIRFERLKASCAPQIVNHFECHTEISNKSKLFTNLTAYCTGNKVNLGSIIPTTFVVDFRNNNYFSQIHSFKVFMINVKSKNLPSTHYAGKNVWIIKPAGFNRGRGIKVFNDFDVLDEIVKDILSSKAPGSAMTYVIQKYIEKPLLVNCRKFDIRVWVLVTQSENCYFFPQGYLRTSSEKFSLENLDSTFIHLTNNAIQKEGTEYGKFEAGNQMSFKQFQEYLLAHHGNIRVNSMISIMKSQIITSLLSVKGKLNPNGRLGCFEIFGYDFIIDSCFKPWLIEVNTNPCIELSSPLLEQIIPRMLDDALELALDSAFAGPRNPLETTQVIDLPSGNLWEFLVSLSSSAALVVSGINL